MKRYFIKFKSLAFWALACAGLTSCGDFLYIEPKTFVSEDNFWNEKTDIDQMVTGLYVMMQSNDYISRCIMWGETRSDNISEGLNCASNLDIYRTLKENLLSSNNYTNWISFYKVINACNIIIERAPEVSKKDPVYTESDVLATKAECSFLRDLSYFYLVRAFKDVPYYTRAIQSDDDVPELPAVSGDSIVKCLIADLEENVGNALKAYPKDNRAAFDSNCNRVTQSAIYALLADLCLWDGQYQKTVDYCKKVIDFKYNKYQEDYSNSISSSLGNVTLFKNPDDTYSKGYPLYPCFSGSNYGNDFNQIFGDQMNSFESVFELAFTYDGSENTYNKNTSFSSLYGAHSENASANDGKGYLAANEILLSDLPNKSGQIFDHQYDVRYYSFLNNTRLSSNEYSEGYSAKYVAKDVSISQEGGKTIPFTPTFSYDINSSRNFIFYRLTDVMLMQAQALIELGQEIPTSMDEDGNVITYELDDNLKKAFYLIWTVNRRSIMISSTSEKSDKELLLKNFNHKSLLEDLVLKERRRELMFEGKRWFDLLRLCHRDGTTLPIKSRVSAKGSTGVSATLFTNFESLFWPYNKDEVRENNALNQKPFYGNDEEDKNYKTTN